MTKPFVKWVGGKTQLLPEIRKKYPQKIEKYCEPFLGGGAVLLDVLQNFCPKEVLVNDINKDLINTYIQIKTNIEPLIAQLQKLKLLYQNTSENERKDFYLQKRTRFNQLILQNAELQTETEKIEKASLFIFLNKTCFNGLYRVNSKGEFNVPFNNAKNPPICDEENLRECNKLFQNITFLTGDYTQCKNFIDEKTFVYIDPPYRPLTESSSFTSYSKNGFTDKDQIELGTFITEIAQKGAKVVASNSDPKNVDEKDNFFDELYSKFEVNRISASRLINSDAKKRGAINELLITNVAANF